MLVMTPYFIKYSADTSIVLPFYLNTLFMNKVSECHLPNIACRHCFGIIFSEKECMLYSIKYGAYANDSQIICEYSSSPLWAKDILKKVNLNSKTLSLLKLKQI
jgi:hypothetical protein